MATKKDDMLEELLAQYDATKVYTPKTEDELKAQAAAEFQTQYDNLRLAAQQQHARNDLALQQQREGLQQTYDAQRDASAKQYRQAYSKADRQMLGRGMQRSTYASQTLANIDQQGAEAQQKLWDAQGSAESNIDAQRAQLAQQLADLLAQYDTNQSTDVMNRARELEDQEYTRSQQTQSAKNSLAMQIYNLLANTEGASSGSASAGSTATTLSGTGYTGNAYADYAAGNSNKKQTWQQISKRLLGADENAVQVVPETTYPKAKSKTNKSTATTQQQSQTVQPTTTASLINALSAPTTKATVNAVSNPGKTKVPTFETTVLSGPVDTSFLAGLNQMGASENKRFESELANALKQKK